MFSCVSVILNSMLNVQVKRLKNFIIRFLQSKHLIGSVSGIAEFDDWEDVDDAHNDACKVRIEKATFSALLELLFLVWWLDQTDGHSEWGGLRSQSMSRIWGYNLDIAVHVYGRVGRIRVLIDKSLDTFCKEAELWLVDALLDQAPVLVPAIDAQGRSVQMKLVDFQLHRTQWCCFWSPYCQHHQQGCY